MKQIRVKRFIGVSLDPFSNLATDTYELVDKLVPEDKTHTNYTRKLIQSGDITELYIYEQPVLTGKTGNKKGRGGTNKEKTEEEKKDNREKTLNKSKRNLRRLINTNISDNSKFITLTFRDNIQDLTYANNELKKFFMRLEYHIGIKSSYVYVIEFQKRGAIHYHAILFNVPYIANKELSDIWGHGFVKVTNIKQVDNVGAYVIKYMSKDLIDDRLTERKCYGHSKNLKQPIEEIEDKKIDEALDKLPSNSNIYNQTFTNDYNNTTYIQFKPKK